MLSLPRLARAPNRLIRVITDNMCRASNDVCLMSDHVKAVALTVCTPMVFQQTKMILLSGRGNETALAEANAALRRMDQVAELLGTLAFGWCITHHGNLVVLPVITGLAFLALPFEIWAIQRVSVLDMQFSHAANDPT